MRNILIENRLRNLSIRFVHNVNVENDIRGGWLMGKEDILREEVPFIWYVCFKNLLFTKIMWGDIYDLNWVVIFFPLLICKYSRRKSFRMVVFFCFVLIFTYVIIYIIIHFISIIFFFISYDISYFGLYIFSSL